MADAPIPTPPGGVAQTNLPGTTIPLPVGSGVEELIPISPPFRNNAPPWYTPPGTVWSKLGCAVPQPGRYLHTNNGVIYDFTNMVGRALFDVFWRWPDRKLDRFPSRDCLWEIHQLLVIGRTRLVAKATPGGETPLVPTHAVPAPKMFLVYPIPLYGPLGTINQYLRVVGELGLMMASEAMQHADAELSFYVTQEFFNVIYPYIKYLLVDMATKFFGIAKDVASKDDFVIPASAWQAYNPTVNSVSFEATSTRPPIGYTATDLDLEPIRGLPIQQVVPFLQPWPDSVLKYSTGGIWGNSGSPAGDVASSGATVTAAGGLAAIFQRSGPP